MWRKLIDHGSGHSSLSLMQGWVWGKWASLYLALLSRGPLFPFIGVSHTGPPWAFSEDGSLDA